MLDKDFILEKDVKEDAKFFQQVWYGLDFADNIIHIGTDPDINISQDIIYFILDVSY